MTLQFVFFDGEEAQVEFTQTDGLYGSRALAAAWRSTPDPVLPNLNKLQTIVISEYIIV